MQGTVGEKLGLGYVIKADAYGGVFKEGTEELLALLKGLLRTLAVGDIFRQPY